MLTPNKMLCLIDDARELAKINNVDFAKRAEMTEERWRDLRTGRRKPTLEELPRLAKAAGISFGMVAPHHQPFTQLGRDEAAAVLQLAEHYKRNGPKKEHALRTAVEILTGSR